MLLLEPRAYIGERDKELGAGTERVVMPLGLERRTDQIGRDDVQMEMSGSQNAMHDRVLVLTKESVTADLLH